MIMTSLAGCIFPHQFQGTHVGSFETDSLGTGTSNSNDTIVSLELINFSVNIILNVISDNVRMMIFWSRNRSRFIWDHP